jgi:hypothetical protein
MAKILLQEGNLFEERLAHIRRRIFEGFQRPGKVINLHREGLDFLTATRFFSSPFI